MVIKFLGNQPQERFIRLSVMYNNNSDAIIFILNKIQSNIDLSTLKPYLKIISGDFADKDGNFDIVIDEYTIRLIYKLTSNITALRYFDGQLLFEDASNLTVWQSVAFNVMFNESLNIDNPIQNKYPTVLQDFENRISILESSGEIIKTISEDLYTHIADSEKHLAAGDRENLNLLADFESRLSELERVVAELVDNANIDYAAIMQRLNEFKATTLSLINARLG